MAKSDVYNASNQKVETLELADNIFGAPVKEHLCWEVVRNQLMNRRAGTKKTKSRAEVNRSGAKMYRQKGTGRARAGNARSGVRVGGGHIFALVPKDWTYKVPKKVRRQAVISALSSKLAEGKLTVVDGFHLEEVKTRAMAAILKSLEIKSGLIVIAQRDEKIEMSMRNIPFVKVLPVEGLNVYDILRYDRLVVTKEAVEKIEGEVRPMINSHQIIKRPIITEKTNLNKEKSNHHIFEVASSANKIEIRRAVEELFGVQVLTVQTTIIRGKNKRRGRHFGRTPNWKKAIVKLAPGESIDFFEGV